MRRCFCLTHCLGIADNLIQFLKRFGLFVREQLGIPDDIDEQDMRDLEAWLDFLVIRHLRRNVKRTPSTALDDFFHPPNIRWQVSRTGTRALEALSGSVR